MESPAKAPQRRLKGWLRPLGRGLLAAAGLVAAYGLYFGVLQLCGNFHEVVPGEFYRAAQPSGKDIAHYASAYGIKSIINLRGENPDSPWYREEIAASAQAGIAHYDFKMSAGRELSAERSRALIALMESAPKPVLVHCNSGVDRTGLATAYYLASAKHADEATAEWQLMPLYGHLPLWFMHGYAMDDSFEMMEPSFGYFDSRREHPATPRA